MNKNVLSEIIGVGIHTGLRKMTNSPEGTQAWKAIAGMPDKEWDNICYAVADDVIHYIAASKQLAKDLEKALEEAKQDGK